MVLNKNKISTGKKFLQFKVLIYGEDGNIVLIVKNVSVRLYFIKFLPLWLCLSFTLMVIYYRDLLERLLEWFTTIVFLLFNHLQAPFKLWVPMKMRFIYAGWSMDALQKGCKVILSLLYNRSLYKIFNVVVTAFMLKSLDCQYLMVSFLSSVLWEVNDAQII